MANIHALGRGGITRNLITSELRRFKYQAWVCGWVCPHRWRTVNCYFMYACVTCAWVIVENSAPTRTSPVTYHVLPVGDVI